METMLEQVLPFGTLDQVPQMPSADGTGSSNANANNADGAAAGAGAGGGSVASGSHSTSVTAGPHVSGKGRRGQQDDASKQQPGVYVPPAHQSSVWNSDVAIPPADRLASFYKKYNRVLLDNIAIEKERSRLATENAQLEDLLQQYLDGTRLTDSTLAEDNPLFVVNGRSVCFSFFTFLWYV